MPPLVSKDYNKFELLDFNRDVERTKKLEVSMSRYGFEDAKPIMVERNGNGKLKIKDGHNRFWVARKLGLPVKYEVSTSGITIADLDGSKKMWTFRNYLDGFTRKGVGSYVRLKEFHMNTGIDIKSCISMFSGLAAGSRHFGDKFKYGQFKSTDKGVKHAEMVGDLVTILRDAGIKWATNCLLVQSLSRVMFAKDYNHDTMKKKLKTFFHLLQKQPTMDCYMDMLDEIYNHMSRTRTPLKFQADEAARQRSLAFKKA